MLELTGCMRSFMYFPCLTRRTATIVPLQVVLLVLFSVFAIVHSGLASLRDAGEGLIGERAYRVLFAGVSLPLALTTIVSLVNLSFSLSLSLCVALLPAGDPSSGLLLGALRSPVDSSFSLISGPLMVFQVYFINHRYEGTQLWQVQSVPGVHELVWVASFVSFFFLYPSTFNLLEVAAVDKPKMHLWETGIIRITRHPQVNERLF